jgi:hypothetical protein
MARIITLRIAIAVGAVAVAAGCGQAAGGSRTARPSGSMRRIPLPAAHSPVIGGGSPAQRRLLGRIVRRTRPTQIRTLKIVPATKDWHPIRPGDVELLASEAPVPHGHDNSLGDWETWLVGGAFRDRSAALGLPRVVVVGYGSGAGRVTYGTDPPPARASGLAAFRRRVQAIASMSGARVVAVRAGLPDGYSAAVTLQVANPVWFLRHRLSQLQLRLHRLRSDGTFIALYEADGRPLYVQGGSTRLQSGLAGMPDHRYASCVQFGFGGPATLAPPLPCPSGWRPPPTTPPKRLALHGWESGGQAERGSAAVGDRVEYLPGTTIGLGFVLENPNGRPVTVRAITPTVAAGAPIRYTGARIRIPRSRAKPGTAAELGQRPYPPEPRFAPFTIRPGDWAGINLHYAIRRACTAATAGGTITENRTLTVIYTMQGKTHTATYENTAFTITLPARCPGS